MIDTQFEFAAAEHVRLMELETEIENGLRTFVDVGNALLEIRDGRLYRQTFGTFEDYCRERWGFTRMHASRLIGAAEVVANVTDRLQIAPPSNIEQTRPLTALEPDQQRAAWQRAVETAPNGKVTAAHVESIAREYHSDVVGFRRFSDGAIDDRITTERVARVVWDLATGVHFSTLEAAALVNMTAQGAHAMLSKLCREIPVTLENGTWRRME